MGRWVVGVKTMFSDISCTHNPMFHKSENPVTIEIFENE